MGSAASSANDDGAAEKNSLLEKLYRFESLHSPSIVQKTSLLTPARPLACFQNLQLLTSWWKWNRRGQQLNTIATLVLLTVLANATIARSRLLPISRLLPCSQESLSSDGTKWCLQIRKSSQILLTDHLPSFDNVSNAFLFLYIFCYLKLYWYVH